MVSQPASLPVGRFAPPRFYFLIEGILDLGRRINRASSAIYQGAWLGSLDAEQITDITLIYYTEKAVHWNADQWASTGLKPWEAGVVENRFKDCRSVLVGSAGGGREVLALAERGFDVFAFECSPSMVETARARMLTGNATAKIVQAAPDEVPQLGTFDGAIVGWGGYMHIVGSQKRITFLRGFRSQVRDGSPLLVSFLTRQDESRMLSTIAKVGSAIRRLRGKPPVELGDELTKRYAHLFTRAEIERELAQAGFRLDDFSDRDDYAVATAV